MEDETFLVNNSVEADKAVLEIAAKYRDPEAVKFAINDYRDWLNDNS